LPGKCTRYQSFRDFSYSRKQCPFLHSGMTKFRLWLIPTDFTMLELRQWHEENPDDLLPLSIEMSDELVELSMRVMETAEKLEWYAEALRGRPPSMN